MPHLKIELLRQNNLDNLRPLLNDYPYNEYRNYKIFNKDLREKILFHQVADIVRNKDGFCFVIPEKDKILGLISLINLAWDSRHFGFKMAKIGYLIYQGTQLCYELINAVIKICQEEKIKHLSFRVDTQDFFTIHALQKSGFYLVETLLTYTFTQANKISPLKDIYKVREFKKEDLPYLMDIAKASFSQNRFHIDPYIPKDKADSLYSEWVKNSLFDRDTAFTFVAERGERAVGFFYL